MEITVKNPIDGTDVTVDLDIQVNVMVSSNGTKTLSVFANARKEV
jgi:hypothetical protein